MTTNYYLKSEINKDGTQAIILFIRFEDNLLRFGTGQKIKLSDWNPKKNVQRARSSFLGYNDLNLFLDNLENKARNIHTQCIATGQPAYLEHIRAELNKFMNKDVVKVTPKPDLFLYESDDKSSIYDEFIKRTDITIKESTRTKYKAIKSNLLRFVADTGFKLTFENINADFNEKYRLFCIKEEKDNESTISDIKRVKTFMSWSKKKKYHNNSDYKEELIVADANKGEKEVIALENEELFRLYHWDFSAHPSFEKVRDFFCFCCFTGLRYSDSANIDNAIIAKGFIDLTILKTSKRAHLPLNNFALQILEKYDHKLPVISNQKTNKILKKVAKKIELNSKVVKTRFIGDKRIDTPLFKHEAISTHLGRKTFISLSLERGIPQDVLMKLSCHDSFESFKCYVAIADRRKSEAMQYAWSSENIPLLKAV